MQLLARARNTHASLYHLAQPEPGDRAPRAQVQQRHDPERRPARQPEGEQITGGDHQEEIAGHERRQAGRADEELPPHRAGVVLDLRPCQRQVLADEGLQTAEEALQRIEGRNRGLGGRHRAKLATRRGRRYLMQERTVRKNGAALEVFLTRKLEDQRVQLVAIHGGAVVEFDKQPCGWKIVGIRTREGAGCSPA